MRISAELRDYEAAGSLAEELPYWGWLEDGRTCQSARDSARARPRFSTGS